MTDSAPTIVFLGTHGQYNIGDELLLETFLHQLGEDADYVINTYDADFTAAQLAGRYRAVFIDTARDRRALVRHVRRADAVVFGGGSIVKELYATTGRNRYATLVMILAIVLFARFVARVPIGMFHIGVGPIRSRVGRWLAKAIIAQASIVTVRDRASFALCQRIGVGEKVRLSADAVFSVTAPWLVAGAAEDTRTPTDDAPGGDGDALKIALNLNYDIENPHNWENFQRGLAAVFSTLAEERPLEIHGLPMQSRGKEHDDASVLRAFASRVPDVRFVEHRPETPAQAARLIASCDLLVSERLHAIVIASLVGVPAFALAYDVKVRELAEMLDMSDASVDINRPLDIAATVRSFEGVLADLDGLQGRQAARASMWAQRVGADFADTRTWLRECVR